MSTKTAEQRLVTFLGSINLGSKVPFKSRLLVELNKCKRCGFCNPVCPVGLAHDYVENRGPRGRLLLLHGLVEGDLEISEKIVEALFSCLVCGRCTVECPSGIRVNDLVVGGRWLLSSLTVRKG